MEKKSIFNGWSSSFVKIAFKGVNLIEKDINENINIQK